MPVTAGRYRPGTMLFGNAFSTDPDRCFRWVYEEGATRPTRCTGGVATRRAGLPVIDRRIPFPGSGQQQRFEAEFAVALKDAGF
jgi:hypothetical protein